eukprot:gnl/MRDRNA2_/MRDRNA2_28987_c0_seq1.p1 gnl/MRDRNA2_/MRDRNA2_28987_c0~~gnl/MRDRNA2_/MRDRNA2_28987_c0_seq1.p1  ORF type:complete len:288 (-),score=72.79 gnl/MRDRNA2_/MRDRNA2_28987_c0_seq1:202-1065(-)
MSLILILYASISIVTVTAATSKSTREQLQYGGFMKKPAAKRAAADQNAVIQKTQVDPKGKTQVDPKAKTPVDTKALPPTSDWSLAEQKAGVSKSEDPNLVQGHDWWWWMTQYQPHPTHKGCVGCVNGKRYVSTEAAVEAVKKMKKESFARKALQKKLQGRHAGLWMRILSGFLCIACMVGLMALSMQRYKEHTIYEKTLKAEAPEEAQEEVKEEDKDSVEEVPFHEKVWEAAAGTLKTPKEDTMSTLSTKASSEEEPPMHEKFFKDLAGHLDKIGKDLEGALQEKTQ